MLQFLCKCRRVTAAREEGGGATRRLIATGRSRQHLVDVMALVTSQDDNAVQTGRSRQHLVYVMPWAGSARHAGVGCPLWAGWPRRRRLGRGEAATDALGCPLWAGWPRRRRLGRGEAATDALGCPLWAGWPRRRRCIPASPIATGKPRSRPAAQKSTGFPTMKVFEDPINGSRTPSVSHTPNV